MTHYKIEQTIAACQSVVDGLNTVVSAARQYGLAVSTVRRALRRAGVPPLKKGRPAHPIVLKMPNVAIKRLP